MIKSINLKYNSKADLETVKKDFINHPCEQILIQVFSGLIERDKIELILDDLKSCFPNIPIIGTTTAGEIMGSDVMDESVIINICFFESTRVNTTLVTHNHDLVATANEISASFSNSNPKAIILFGCGLKDKRTIDATILLSTLYSKFPETIIAGAQAGDNGIVQCHL